MVGTKGLENTLSRMALDECGLRQKGVGSAFVGCGLRVRGGGGGLAEEDEIVF